MEVFVCISLILLSVILLFVFIPKKHYDKISFKESYDLTELPIITFSVNNKKYNFLLDTGANYSVINKKVLRSIKHEKSPIKGTIYGLEGNEQPVEYVDIVLSYKGNEFTESMQVVDMSAAFGNIKKESGVNLHGILGSLFFQKYKYIIDFKEFVAYSKK